MPPKNELIRDEHFFRRIVENLNQEIFVCDAEGTIIYLNSFSEYHIGHKKENLLGKNIGDLVDRGVISKSVTQQVIKTKRVATIIQKMETVIDNEIAEMINYSLRGIDVTDYRMATDVIKEVGIGGEFVSHDHTFSNFRTNQSSTSLFDRRMREGWLDTGGKDLLERATEKAKWILENHKPDPLPDGTAQLMEDIIAEATEEEGL